MTDHPITPPPELAAKWLAEIYDHPATFRSTPSITLELVERAAQWGADQELEACCDWMSECTVGCPNELRAARRPKPPSLKEQALGLLNEGPVSDLLDHEVAVIRRALESLPG